MTSPEGITLPVEGDPFEGRPEALPGFELDGWRSNGWDDERGTFWVLEDCEGWDDTPDMRGDFPDRIGADGVFFNPARYGGRVIVLTGVAASLTRTAAQQSKDILRSVAHLLDRTYELMGTDVAATRYSQVRRSAQGKIAHLGAQAFRYQLTLTAPDPLLYGPPEDQVQATLNDLSGVVGGDWKFDMTFPYGFGGGSVGAGLLYVRNRGTAPSWPTFRVEGPGTGLVLGHVQSGAAITIPTLQAGQFLTLDTLNRQVLLMGTQPRRDLISPTSQWFPLVPGDNVVRFFAPNYSAAKVTMTWRSAWL